jgi:beta-lactam-binding protein with PASTA domain
VRRFFSVAIKVLVLIGVAMISAMTAMRFAIHGREVYVPKLVSIQQAQAEQVAQDNGLALLVEERFYSADVKEGSVLSQQPAPGTRVRRGGRVRVAVSLGPMRAQIPDVTGQSQRVAEINLHRRGLEVGSVALTKIPGAPLGQIIGQSPPANASSANAPRVNMLVADPLGAEAYVMPNLVGKPFDEVRNQIETAGLKVKSIPIASATTPPALTGSVPKPGTVLKQLPLAGVKIVSGTEILLDVAK